jgi:plastocyanin
MRSSAAPVCLAAVTVAAVSGCGDDNAGGLSSEPVPDDPDAVVVAEAMAFDPDEVRVPAGEPVSIVLDNRDDGVNHNLHVVGAPAADKTALERGPSQQALIVTLDVGEYEFVCDIHPDMTGSLLAE